MESLSASGQTTNTEKSLSQNDSLTWAGTKWLEQIELDLSLKERYKLYPTQNMYNFLLLDTKTGQIEQVLCDGENYDGARPCHFDWVRSLRQECVDNNVTFVFCGTGRRFVKDGRLYKIEGNGLQSQQAYKSGMSFKGKPMHFDLYNDLGYPLPDEDRYKPTFRERCDTCGMRLTCNGCSSCGKCEK